MKTKFMTMAVLLAGIAAGSDANAAYSEKPTVRNMVYGGVDSRREVKYEQPFQGQFYLAAKFAFNLASFSNEYYLQHDASVREEDSFSFVRQLGVDASLGYQFAPKWRAELNYGYTGEYETEDSAATFGIASQYLTANALYTINQWDATSLYGGFGLGAAMLQTSIAGPLFLADGEDTQNHATFAGQLMLGLEHSLAPNFAVGLQYRLMYNGGATHKRTDTGGDVLVAEIGGVFTNSVTFGARFKF